MDKHITAIRAWQTVSLFWFATTLVFATLYLSQVEFDAINETGMAANNRIELMDHRDRISVLENILADPDVGLWHAGEPLPKGVSTCE